MKCPKCGNLDVILIETDIIENKRIYVQISESKFIKHEYLPLNYFVKSYKEYFCTKCKWIGRIKLKNYE